MLILLKLMRKSASSSSQVCLKCCFPNICIPWVSCGAADWKFQGNSGSGSQLCPIPRFYFLIFPPPHHQSERKIHKNSKIQGKTKPLEVSDAPVVFCSAVGMMKIPNIGDKCRMEEQPERCLLLQALISSSSFFKKTNNNFTGSGNY